MLDEKYLKGCGDCVGGLFRGQISGRRHAARKFSKPFYWRPLGPVNRGAKGQLSSSLPIRLKHFPKTDDESSTFVFFVVWSSPTLHKMGSVNAIVVPLILVSGCASNGLRGMRLMVVFIVSRLRLAFAIQSLSIIGSERIFAMAFRLPRCPMAFS